MNFFTALIREHIPIQETLAASGKQSEISSYFDSNTSVYSPNHALKYHLTAQRELLPLIPQHYQVLLIKLNVLIDVTPINVNCTSWRDFDVNGELFIFKNVDVIGNLFIFQDVDVIEIWHCYRKSARHSTG